MGPAGLIKRMGHNIPGRAGLGILARLTKITTVNRCVYYNYDCNTLVT